MNACWACSARCERDMQRVLGKCPKVIQNAKMTVHKESRKPALAVGKSGFSRAQLDKRKVLTAGQTNKFIEVNPVS